MLQFLVSAMDFLFRLSVVLLIGVGLLAFIKEFEQERPNPLRAGVLIPWLNDGK